MSSSSINGLLLKVASRCNLNCDYCYVYRHADQSWRKQPALLAEETLGLFISRAKEYVEATQLRELSVIFHGGEPLLYGANRLAKAASRLRDELADLVDLDISLQTNGVLLTEEALIHLKDARIGVSVSIDGPRRAHDLHRLTHAGESSFDATMAAIQLLRHKGSEIFSGAIAVIDPSITPTELLEFVSGLDLPRFDILLPDATHANPPSGRETNRDLYTNWLCEAFRVWVQDYSHIPVRWFDAIMGAQFGVPCPTDVMGFGSVSLLVVETDGTITDHDVFKIVGEGSTSLGCHLETSTFEEAASSSRIAQHAKLLEFEGLSSECKTCPAVSMCGGGAVMHRHHPTRGYTSPTVYCREMFLLLSEAAITVRNTLARDSSTGPLLDPVGDMPALCLRWRDEREKNFGGHRSSRWESLLETTDSESLIGPFKDSIVRCDDDSREVSHLKNCMPAVRRLLSEFDASAFSAIENLLTNICVVKSVLESEIGIFSFSDDSMPDVIYISTYVGDSPLSPEDIADSVLHEFLHHVLYHYEKEHALLYEKEHPKFPAPWTRGLRPSIGFFHGTFVFANLSRYWKALGQRYAGTPMGDKARTNEDTFVGQALYGIDALRRFAILTPAGCSLLDNLESSIDRKGPYLWAQLN